MISVSRRSLFLAAAGLPFLARAAHAEPRDRRAGAGFHRAETATARPSASRRCAASWSCWNGPMTAAPMSANGTAPARCRRCSGMRPSMGAVWISIISSAPGEQGYADGPRANALTQARNAAPGACRARPDRRDRPSLRRQDHAAHLHHQQGRPCWNTWAAPTASRRRGSRTWRGRRPMRARR